MLRYMRMTNVTQRELTLTEYRDQAGSIIDGALQARDARIGRTPNVTYADAWQQLARMKEKINEC